MKRSPGAQGPRSPHLLFTQPPFLVAFQGKTFSHVTRAIVPRHDLSHIIRSVKRHAYHTSLIDSDHNMLG
jgi:hypothetical protein